MTSSWWPAIARSASATVVRDGQQCSGQPGPAVWPARRIGAVLLVPKVFFINHHVGAAGTLTLSFS